MARLSSISVVMLLISTLLTACGSEESIDVATTVTVVTSTVDGRPDNIPEAVIPDGAEVTGIIAQAGAAQGSSAAEFTLVGDIERDVLADTARTAIEIDGWTFVERAYDATTMVMTFTRDAATLTWTLRLTETGAAGSVVVVGG